jgi:hypothetical protein
VAGVLIYPAIVLLVGGTLAVNAVESFDLGDTLTGFGQLFLGLAATVAAVASLVNNRRIGDAKVKAGEAAQLATVASQHSASAAAALGPANGHTVLELLAEIRDFEEYQHGRNHDILNELTHLKASTPMLLDAVERLIAKLREAP